ncbi:hypothetical protein [uncultured Flavonifractor sp.]|uniref:Uncharacterized protein n=1 Tax=Candidatus Flavonifractor intestinigallinarum TaxID=2838586 RepID=A0A9D2MLY3_9FIRM|nr:hypothetical protein [uncultured Flavonifractor sp.]HJB80865.1 hypothetical protein [Candidatus Flavonifractor intestinigallinarum]
MLKDDKYRFCLGWSRDSAEKAAVGDLLEKLNNRKSEFIIQAVWEYIGHHPEVMTESARIVIAVRATPTDEQKLAQIQSMIDASIERLRDSLKLQNKQGQQEETDGPSDKDLDDMLSNLDIFNQ